MSTGVGVASDAAVGAVVGGEVGGCVATGARVASPTRVALGVGVRMTMVGVARVVGCAVASTLALGDGFTLAIGFALGESFARGDGDGLDDAEALGEAARDGVGDGAAANVAVLSGSGVKLGRAVGVCTAPPAPKIFVSKPPSSRPPRITSTINGMMGIPPRLGGSGSSRRRRG